MKRVWFRLDVGIFIDLLYYNIFYLLSDDVPCPVFLHFVSWLYAVV